MFGAEHQERVSKDQQIKSTFLKEQRAANEHTVDDAANIETVYLILMIMHRIMKIP